MADRQVCSECGSELPADAPGGICPKCLLGLGLAEGANATVEFSSPAGKPFLAPPPEEIAKYFPQLEILELLGQGGMGAVYKARQPGLDRLVAVKILPSQISRTPGFAERFAREGRALARLNHPNIVTVYDSGERDGLFYFIMEFIDGANLREMTQAGVLSPLEAMAIVPQICEALQFAHSNGIVHRDIKPENILVDKTGRVKIADFGLAKLASGEDQLPDSARHLTLTGTHQVMGTPRYMAPEQIEGSHHVDHRADIYSLGVVFYELLTGELPLGRFDPPSHKVQIDVRLDEVVLRTLEKSPEKRYQHASEIKTDVETIERSPASPSAPTKVERPTPPVRDVGETLLAEGRYLNRGAALGMGVFAALCLVFAVVGFAWFAVEEAISQRPDPMTQEAAMVCFGILALYGGFVMFVGVPMFHLRWHAFAVVASVILIAPVPLATWIVTADNLDLEPIFGTIAMSIGIPVTVGIPFAIWSLSVLLRQSVRAAYRQAFQERVFGGESKAAGSNEPDPAWGESLVRAAATAMIGVAVFAALIAAALFIWGTGIQPSPYYAGAAAAAAGAIIGYAAVVGFIGWSMLKLRWHLFCAIGAVMLLAPIPILFLAVSLDGLFHDHRMYLHVITAACGIPIALWTTAIIWRRDVQASFAQVREERLAVVEKRPFDPRRAVLPPAIAMMLIGIALVVIPFIPTFVVAYEWSRLVDSGEVSKLHIVLMCVLLPVAVALGVSVIVAGWRMKDLKNYRFVLGSLIVSMTMFMTLWPALPLFIWILWTLLRSDIREAFQRRAEQAHDERTGKSATVPGKPPSAMLIAGVLLLLVALLLGGGGVVLFALMGITGWLFALAGMLAVCVLSLAIVLIVMGLRLRRDVRRAFAMNAELLRDQPRAKLTPDEIAAAADSLPGPGVGLIVSGVLLLFFMGPTSIIAYEFLFDENPSVPKAVPVVGVMIGISALMAVLQIAGGILMGRARAWPLCVAASVAAMLPLSFAWFVALAQGIWAICVLLRQDIRQLFAADVNVRQVRERARETQAVPPRKLEESPYYAAGWLVGGAMRFATSSAFAVTLAFLAAATVLLPWGYLIHRQDGEAGTELSGIGFASSMVVAALMFLCGLFLLATGGMRRGYLWRPVIVVAFVLPTLAAMGVFPHNLTHSIFHLGDVVSVAYGYYTCWVFVIALLVVAALQVRAALSK